MKLYLMSGEVFGWGQFAPSGTLMLLKPWPLYSFVAPGLFVSQCNAIARQPQFLASASAFSISFFAIPLRRNRSRTATFDMYAIPVLPWKMQKQARDSYSKLHHWNGSNFSWKQSMKLKFSGKHNLRSALSLEEWYHWTVMILIKG